MSKVFYYSGFDEDVTKNSGQDYRMPEGYRIIKDRWWERGLCSVLYAAFAFVGRVYLRVGLHARFVGREKLLRVSRNKGYFIYANHTQPFGDPMIALVAGSGRIRRRHRAIAAPANFGLPVLGRLLTYMGVIPTASSAEGLRKMDEAVSWYCDRAEPVVIFPEAHVWPYYTRIRPFGAAAFHYPVARQLPVFTMTTTYQSRGAGKKPRATIYIDGPFLPEPSLSLRECKVRLCEAVRLVMEVRAESSTCEHVRYERVGII